ncbi:coproporphyrinogen III oxidase [Staphylospora marina]|uniref:coproporphyrinogen III oxidase n=1 Tax=Staphylospora marina TaxID=2490858 RepID=UPI000F5C1169|nr:coproporphyrinogen III oxidase [Staphylospora marina]
MVKFEVRGIQSAYGRDLELIAGLFFEEVKIMDGGDDADGRVTFEVTEGRPVEVWAELFIPADGKRYEMKHSRRVPAGLDDKGYRKKVKQAISFVFLELLEQWTGTRQPWGILTGVRPTKLLHSMLLGGMTEEEAEKELREQYRLHPDKIAVLREIVRRQRTVLPDLYDLDKEVSLYVGIPFCPTKCAYCTFPAYSIQGRTGSVTEFLKGLHEEVEAVGAWIRRANLPVTTVYFGGGTPTSISARQMDDLFDALERHIPGFESVRELTVEAGRPDTLDEEKISLMKRRKVDRISINPQSFREDTLKLIGRHHTVRETLDKYRLARELGLNNINMDLIIGLPGEGIEVFRESLAMVDELRPESITVHTLSFKRGSVMTNNREKYRVAGRDETGEMVRMAREWAAEKGYVPYYLYRQKNILGNQENVGYALPGHESLYNIIIMEERHTIIGLGCGAVSKIMPPGTGKVIRWPNPKEPLAYIQTYRDQIRDKLQALDEAYGL